MDRNGLRFYNNPQCLPSAKHAANIFGAVGGSMAETEVKFLKQLQWHTQEFWTDPGESGIHTHWLGYCGSVFLRGHRGQCVQWKMQLPQWQLKIINYVGSLGV